MTKRNRFIIIVFTLIAVVGFSILAIVKSGGDAESFNKEGLYKLIDVPKYESARGATVEFVEGNTYLSSWYIAFLKANYIDEDTEKPYSNTLVVVLYLNNKKDGAEIIIDPFSVYSKKLLREKVSPRVVDIILEKNPYNIYNESYETE